MKKIGFYGLGLIGGSLARSIKRVHEEYELYACDADPDILRKAKESGVIDEICDETDPRLFQCDYLFLSAPVEFNVQFLYKAKGLLSGNCILTDTGSVKSPIHKKVEELGLSGHFIGGHPMAGSEKSGFEASRDRLFENAYYMITPGDVPIDVLTDFTQLITDIGALPMLVTPEEHDFMTAGVSHLPHIVASALVNLVKALDNDQHYMKSIAAGGFRDITRIASSSPVMWQQICLENKGNISNVLDDFIRLLVQIRCYIDSADQRSIYEMFCSSRDYRDSIDVTDSGPIRKSYVLYLDIADEAGGIATIATILAMDGINIKNIGIIHNREFEQGVLKIEFYEGASMERARVLLTKRNYVIYSR